MWTNVSQILTRSGRDTGLSYAEEMVSISAAVSAHCMNVTDRPQHYNNLLVKSLSVMSPNNDNSICLYF